MNNITIPAIFNERAAEAYRLYPQMQSYTEKNISGSTKVHYTLVDGTWVDDTEKVRLKEKIAAEEIAARRAKIRLMIEAREAARLEKLSKSIKGE